MISLIISRNYIVRRKRGDFIKKVQNNEHIEKIDKGINKDIESIDHVLVIWCAKSPTNDFTSVVGCYKNATVYRGYQSVEFIIYLTFENGLLIHNIVE